MPRIAITGYVDVSPELADWIRSALIARLRELVVPGWRGITCLARGADQLFADAVIALDGPFDVVLPSHDYEQSAIGERHRAAFRTLLARADDVETMPFAISNRTAYLAASEQMLNRCDRLLAVWDGTPSRRMGDTADVVVRALARQIPVDVVWPSENHIASLNSHRRRLQVAADPAPAPSPFDVRVVSTQYALEPGQ